MTGDQADLILASQSTNLFLDQDSEGKANTRKHLLFEFNFVEKMANMMMCFCNNQPNSDV
jgi:hypothetical protein